MIIVATKKSEQNLALLDPWSAVHFGTGLAVGLMGISTGAAIAGAVLYELAERPFEAAGFGKTIFNVSKPETTGNAVADVLIFALGLRAGQKWNRS